MWNFPECHKGQGATQSCSGTIYCPLVGQGATEYLVLLAVVLIVALVSVALLGFFPGMASDAQYTQSQAYWQSTSPIAVVESSAMNHPSVQTISFIYLRIRNAGTYPIRITKLLGNGDNITQIISAAGWTYSNISDLYYMAPGEEKYFGRMVFAGVPAERIITFGAWDVPSLAHPASTCALDGTGIASMKDFGFEYIGYIDGQQITKREVGAKPIMLRCQPW